MEAESDLVSGSSGRFRELSRTADHVELHHEWAVNKTQMREKLYRSNGPCSTMENFKEKKGMGGHTDKKKTKRHLYFKGQD